MIALFSIIALGFFLGIRHAADTGHVIAVTTIVSQQGTVRHARIWSSRRSVLNRIRALIADDNPALLARLVSLLETEFDVVCTAENGQMALECARRYQPDIAVLDLEMPFLNGIEVTLKLKKLAPSVRVVICSVETDAEIVEAARQAGALGYVFKKHMTRDLIVAVRSAACGQSFISST